MCASKHGACTGGELVYEQNVYHFYCNDQHDEQDAEHWDRQEPIAVHRCQNAPHEAKKIYKFDLWVSVMYEYTKQYTKQLLKH